MCVACGVLWQRLWLIQTLRPQIAREPYEFPTVTFKRPLERWVLGVNHVQLSLAHCKVRLEDFTFDDIELHNYKFHDKIAMAMAV